MEIRTLFRFHRVKGNTVDSVFLKSHFFQQEIEIQARLKDVIDNFSLPIVLNHSVFSLFIQVNSILVGKQGRTNSNRKYSYQIQPIPKSFDF